MILSYQKDDGYTKTKMKIQSKVGKPDKRRELLIQEDTYHIKKKNMIYGNGEHKWLK